MGSDQGLVEPAEYATERNLARAGGRRARLRTFIVLRWMAVVGQTVTVLVVHFGLGFTLPLGATLAVIAASSWLNLYLSVAQPSQKFLEEWEMAGHLAFDIVQLSALIALTGGMDNPFAVLLGAPVAIGFTAMRTLGAVALAAFAMSAAGVVWLVASPLPWSPDATFDPPDLYEVGLATALVSSTGFMSAFIWRLALDTRRMSDALLATQAVLAREQRLSALGGLAAAAAHELGTPLATIQVTAKEMLRASAGNAELREDAALLSSQAERCRDILQQLSRRGDAEDAVHAQLRLRHLIEEAVDPLQGLGPPIVMQLEPIGSSNAAEPYLRRSPEVIYALTNFLENAMDFAQSRVVVTGRWSDKEVEVEIRDDGPGFDADILTELGQPYVSRRSDGSAHGGLGLGFFIAKTFVERTGGQLRFGNVSPPASGAVVRARWPLDKVRAVPTT